MSTSYLSVSEAEFVPERMVDSVTQTIVQEIYGPYWRSTNDFDRIMLLWMSEHKMGFASLGDAVEATHNVIATLRTAGYDVSNETEIFELIHSLGCFKPHDQ